jgi:hypothetical protein
MKRGTRFSEKVIAFSLTERSRGKRWKDIQNAIRQEFQIEPPTERQMRRWYGEYGGGAIDQEKILRESLIKVARDTIPPAAFATHQLTVQQGIPTLMEAYRQGKDPYTAGVVMILSTLEQMAGSELYEKGIKEYQQERERRGESSKIIGWINPSSPQPTPPIETHSLEEFEKSEERRQQ